MKRRGIFALLLVAGFAGVSRAESPRTTASPDTTFSHMTPTPEMWFYDRAEKEHLNPKAAVRRKAEFETAQRQRRLAAQAWYGISNSRPTVYSLTPFTGGTYSPMWGSNTRDPQRWTTSGTSGTIVIEQPPVIVR
ncbi:MAG TPA: hypothetical protein VHV77_03890 [Pirellulales bacterium]|jgi:hypothetical protein|nr:hypothetical protein [Pirellulales bacterium]